MALPSEHLLFAHVATGQCHVGETLTFFLTQITVKKAAHKLEKSQAADAKKESRVRDRQQLGWTTSWLLNVGANTGGMESTNTARMGRTIERRTRRRQRRRSTKRGGTHPQIAVGSALEVLREEQCGGGAKNREIECAMKIGQLHHCIFKLSTSCSQFPFLLFSQTLIAYFFTLIFSRELKHKQVCTSYTQSVIFVTVIKCHNFDFVTTVF